LIKKYPLLYIGIDYVNSNKIIIIIIINITINISIIV